MVTKLHIDFNQPLKQKDRLISFFTSRKTVAGLIIILIIIWMAPGLLGNKKEEKETVRTSWKQRKQVLDKVLHIVVPDGIDSICLERSGKK